MGRIWSICLFEIGRVFKSPASYILMFAMPLIFALLFANIGGNKEASKFKIGLVDQDQTILSAELVDKLEQYELLAVSISTQDEAEQELLVKNISGVISIPNGYAHKLINGEHVEVFFRHGPDVSIASSIRQTIDNAVAQAAIKIKATQIMNEYEVNQHTMDIYANLSNATATKIINVDSKVVTKGNQLDRSNNQNERLVGFVILFLMITLMVVTGKILEARKVGVWYRMLSTPSRRFEIMGGYMLSFFLIGWLQFAILMIASSVIFGTAWGNLLAQFFLVSALLLCAIGLGLMVAGFVRTSEQQMLFGIIIISPTCMLGGVYYPIELVPDAMQKIGQFVPQYWAMEGFKKVMTHGGTLVDVLGSVAILLGFAAVFMTIGLSRVRYE